MRSIDIRLLSIALLSTPFLTGVAFGEMVHLTIQPGSQVELTIKVASAVGNPSDTQTSVLNGTIEIDLGRTAQTSPSSMSIQQADVDASDVDFQLSFGFLIGSIDASVEGAHFSADTPGSPPDPPVDPADGGLLLADHRLVLDAGLAQYTGNGLLLGGISDSYDFAALPEEFRPPADATGTLEIEPTQINQYLVTLTIPIDSVVPLDTIVVGPVTADLTLEARGTIVATGVVGLLAPLAGDLNGDSALNNLDITPFALALSDAATFAQQFPFVDPLTVGDFNHDGQFNNLDIAPFAAILAGGAAMSVAPTLTTVPEPQSIVLGIAAVLMGVSWAIARPCR